MQIWLEQFIHDFSMLLQKLCPSVKSEIIGNVSAGIIGMYFNVESLVPLGANTSLRDQSHKAAPRFIEAVMNTPSHHRVHHGSNKQYIDKNYAGIFILWDKMSGTFAEEQEKVVYGVLPPINSNNPLKVFFHGLTGLFGKMRKAKGLKNKLLYLIKPPGWHPNAKEKINE